jgi:hypothetical protein
MADTHDIGSTFWHLIRVRKGTPLHHRARTQETDEPYRYAESHVIRLPRGRALVLGRWKSDEQIDEVEALRRAVHIRRGDDGSLTGHDWRVATDRAGDLNLIFNS